MSPRPQTASPTHDSLEELVQSEQDANAAEAQLHAELAELEAAAGELQQRLQRIKANASQVQLAGARDPELAQLQSRLQQAAVPKMAVSEASVKAVEARRRALEARRAAQQGLRAQAQQFAGDLTKWATQLDSDEAALTTLEAKAKEAAAKPVAKVPPNMAPAKPAAVPMPAPAPAEPARPQAAAAPAAVPVRQASRVRMQAAIDFSSDNNFFTGFSTNLSEGGVFIATVNTLPQGTEVDINFTLPGGKRVEAHGVVRWTREVNDNTPEIFPGLGIQFMNLPAESLSAIQSFVKTREPMFFPD